MANATVKRLVLHLDFKMLNLSAYFMLLEEFQTVGAATVKAHKYKQIYNTIAYYKSLKCVKMEAISYN